MVTRKSRPLVLLSALASAALAPRPSHAEAAPPAEPGVLHAPVSTARAAQPLEIVAEIAHPELSKRALVLHRAPDEKTYREVPFRRAARHYRAVIDAAAVRAGGLSYAIELELADGTRVPAFASRSEPFDVQVQRSKADADELAAARRVHDHRSVASSSVEWANFGKADRASEPRASDDYYRVEASYAYRPLRFVNEFGVRLGLVRGTSPQSAEPNATSPTDAREVGLNYAAPWVRLRLHESAFLSGHLLTGVTEVDFSFGAGAALTLGDPYGAHLGLGVESIEGFGTRFFTRVNIVVSDRIALAPIIEATDMPNAGHYGVRLLADLSAKVTPELRLGVLGGYQARNAVSGGPSLGANASYAF